MYLNIMNTLQADWFKGFRSLFLQKYTVKKRLAAITERLKK